MHRTYNTYSDTAITQHDFIHIRTPSKCNHCAFGTIWVKDVFGASTNAGSFCFSDACCNRCGFTLPFFHLTQATTK